MSKVKKGSATFSAGRRWSARGAALVASLSVLAVVAMVNYASQKHFHKRFFLSSKTEVQLSGQTLGLLRSLTNDLEVIVYYDRKETIYPLIASLLKEYEDGSPHVRVRTVDYISDPPEAAAMKLKYNLASVQEKNVVVFDSGEHQRVIPGAILVENKLERVQGAEQLEVVKKPVLFRGEQVFSAAILALTSPKPLKAYYLAGHGEHDPASGDPQVGYMSFTSLLQQNYIRVETLSLLQTNAVPGDCNLLILAGPIRPLAVQEVDRIKAYLNQGGRLLALLNYNSVGRELGIEEVLRSWGVPLGDGVVRDPDNSTSRSGLDILTHDFGAHPVMNPILGSRLHMVLPRPVGPLGTNDTGAAGSQADVTVLAWSSASSLLTKGSEVLGLPGRRPLGVAVEQAEAPGVVTERGVTRMIVLGDSILLGNEMIESSVNREFADSMINWLLDRTALLEGAGPKPIHEYRLVVTSFQSSRIRWLLLGALPAVVLSMGGVIWLTRRR